MKRTDIVESERKEWITPDWLFNKLNEEFHFTLDVCADKNNAKVQRFFTEEDNALKQNWSKDICWMNPPYGNGMNKWIEKAYNESRKGAMVVCLLPARTATLWFHKFCSQAEIRLLRDQLHFQRDDGSRMEFGVTHGSMIVVFGKPFKVIFSELREPKQLPKNQRTLMEVQPKRT